MADIFTFLGLIVLTFIFVFALGWMLDKLGLIE
jgi:hypothetical protein